MKSASDDIYKRLTGVFHVVFDDDSITLRPETTAKDIDEWDSLMHITLVVHVEKEFAIRLNAAEVGAMKNVGGMVALIESKA